MKNVSVAPSFLDPVELVDGLQEDGVYLKIPVDDSVLPEGWEVVRVQVRRKRAARKGIGDEAKHRG